MTSKHTPGPWAMDEDKYGEEIDVYPLKDGPPPMGRWAEICTVKDYESQDEMRANARLIAAAPDLLEALKLACELLEYGGFDMEKFHAAIAKAEGRS